MAGGTFDVDLLMTTMRTHYYKPCGQRRDTTHESFPHPGAGPIGSPLRTGRWQPQARGSSSHDTPQRSASQPEARSRQPRARSATPRTEVRYSYAFRLILGWGRLGPGARPDRDAVRTHALSCRYAIVDLAIIGSCLVLLTALRTQQTAL